MYDENIRIHDPRGRSAGKEEHAMKVYDGRILEEYRQSFGTFEQLEQTAVACLEKALKESGLMIFQLSHRLKTEESLRGKLEKKGDKYSSLYDITDLLGIRIICYFADDVDHIAESIEGLFDIDRDNSVDKRKILEDDQFGYMSMHYICRLKQEQTASEELLMVRFEIQIRSVLQHAWAEINHDIGYKNKTGVPHSITREFSRLAGLLEIADEQFAEIRDSVRMYQQNSAETVRNGTMEDLPVNEMTLAAYFQNDLYIQDFFRGIGIRLNSEGDEDSVLRLAALDIHTMAQFASLTETFLEKAVELAAYEDDSERPEEISTGFLIRLLIEACLMENPDPEKEIHAYMQKYYGAGELADRREKDLHKYIKRMKKGKSPKTKQEQII